jgi:hypothetical protein
VTLTGTSAALGNTAESGGGALASGVLTGGLYAENVASEEGGGVDIIYGELHDAEIRDNTAPDGGGVWVYTDSVFSGLHVHGNTATARGGGVFVECCGFATAYTYTYVYAGLAVSDTVIEGNTADEGGGIHAEGEWSVKADDTEIRGNTARLGGGAFIDDLMSLELRGASAVVGNVATAEGGGVYGDFGPRTVASYAADWGAASSADDNVPDDVNLAGVLSYIGYEAGETFTCDQGICTPAP